MRAFTCSHNLKGLRGAHPISRRDATTSTVHVTAVADVIKQGAPDKSDVPEGLNKYSSRITQPKSQGASQAMLYATGLREEDMNKPQVGGRVIAIFDSGGESARASGCHCHLFMAGDTPPPVTTWLLASSLSLDTCWTTRMSNHSLLFPSN
jgi:hypothetical protein